MTCARCGAANPAEAQFCAQCGAALRRGGTPPDDAELTAGVVPERLRVAAGSEGSLAMKIRNLGSVVDRLSLAVEGPAASWTELSPDFVRVLPGAEASVEVRVRPPKRADLPAGPVDLVVSVTSAENPRLKTTARGVVEVGPYYDLEARLVPEHKRAWHRTHHTLTVHNGGNSKVAAAVSATDPDDLLLFALSAREVRVPPGRDVSLRVEAVARRWHLWRKTRPLPFTLVVAPEGADKLTAQGTLNQRAVLPLLLLLLLLLAIIVIAVYGHERGYW